MPDRELIHSSIDVVSTLLYAFDSGFQILLEAPQPQAQPRLLLRSEAEQIEGGSFVLFRPEWVYGPFQIMAIPSGHNRGKFFVQPRVNFCPISAYFSGERIDQTKRRLGSGVLSYHRDWLEVPAQHVRKTPPEVKAWFKRIAAHISSGVTVKAGVHRYHICRSVITDPKAAECLPPFDFIPWGADLLHAHSRRPDKGVRRM